MGLPQELIDYIINMHRDDFTTLKACSLTCKAMFTSSRPLLHQRLYLTWRNNWNCLTPQEQLILRHRGSGYRDLELRLLSYVGESGLLRCAQLIHIDTPRPFAPYVLLPHLHHFKTLDLVHTLVIEHHDASLWGNRHRTYFDHLYPTLTSLTLTHPLCGGRFLLRFILQFPNLENLCLEWLKSVGSIQPDLAIPVTAGRSPPLHGCLRLASETTIRWWSRIFIPELQNGVRFRSIELSLDHFTASAQMAIDACAHTVEHLTIITTGNSTYQSTPPLSGMPE